jgi:hypothetical protein
MLVSAGGELVRVQCAFVDTPEVEQIADFIGIANCLFIIYRFKHAIIKIKSSMISKCSYGLFYFT